jgi:hypothetical protein
MSKIEKPPPLNPDRVREFVLAAHRSLEEVKTLLSHEPALVNATWDWGGGDWETALGGAAHTGQREIALYLLANGARLDLFAAAMLGKLEVVKAAVTDDPQIIHVPGPHGIPLLAHAKMGGETAAPVVAYLESMLESGYS